MKLFDFASAQEPAVEQTINDEQVATLRNAFHSAGMEDPDERADLVRSCVIRPISSLRDLYPRDLRPILRRIEERSQVQQRSKGTAWDDREGDTWIDKL